MLPDQPAPQAPEAPQFTPEQLAYQAYLAGEVADPSEYVDPRQQAQPPQVPDPTQPPQAPPVDPALAFQQQYLLQQQAMLAQQAAQAQQYADYAEQVALQQYLSQLDEDKRAIAERIYQYNKGVQGQLQQAQQAQMYAHQLEQAFLPLLKERVLDGISSQYQVEKELLARTNSRAEAENLARAINEYRRRSGWEARKVQNSDRVPTSSQQTNAPTQVPEITRRYKHSGKIRDFVKDMRKAGLWD